MTPASRDAGVGEAGRKPARLINPHLLDATYLKLDRPGPRYRSGMKLYRPAFGSHGAFKGCRHAFRTATRAREHATRVLERWCRLYDALAAHAASTGDAGSKPARGAAVVNHAD